MIRFASVMLIMIFTTSLVSASDYNPKVEILQRNLSLLDYNPRPTDGLWGGKTNGGFYGEQPSLSQLKDGDMEFTTDYRSIYDIVLKSWFSISDNKFSSFKIPGLQKILV